MTSSEAWAWLAGIIEGEGCLAVNSANRQPSITVAMTDEDIVQRCHEVAGVGHVTGPHQASNPRWKPKWSWHVSAHVDVKHVIDRVLPLLGHRRSAKALELLAEISRARSLRCIKHKDGQALNLCYACMALRGKTPKHAKLTPSRVDAIRMRLADGETGVSLAREYGVSPSAISLINRGKNWR